MSNPGESSSIAISPQNRPPQGRVVGNGAAVTPQVIHAKFEAIADLARQKRLSSSVVIADAFLYTLCGAPLAKEFNVAGTTINCRQIDQFRSQWALVSTRLKQELDLPTQLTFTMPRLQHGMTELDQAIPGIAEKIIVSRAKVKVEEAVTKEMLDSEEHLQWIKLNGAPREQFLQQTVTDLLSTLPRYDSVKSALLAHFTEKKTKIPQKALLVRIIQNWETDPTPAELSISRSPIQVRNAPGTTMEESSIGFSTELGKHLSAIKNACNQKEGNQYRRLLFTVIGQIEQERFPIGTHLTPAELKVYDVSFDHARSVLTTLERLNIVEAGGTPGFYEVKRKPGVFLKGAILLATNGSEYTSLKVRTKLTEELLTLAAHPQKLLDRCDPETVINSRYLKVQNPRFLEPAVEKLQQAPLPLLNEDFRWNEALSREVISSRIYERISGHQIEQNTFFPCWALPKFYEGMTPIEVGVRVTGDHTSSAGWECEFTVFDGEQAVPASQWLREGGLDKEPFSGDEICHYVRETASVARELIPRLRVSNKESNTSIAANNIGHFLEITVPALQDLGFRVEVPALDTGMIEQCKPRIAITPRNGDLSVRSIIKSFDLRILVGETEYTLKEIEEVLREGSPFFHNNGKTQLVDEAALREAADKLREGVGTPLALLANKDLLSSETDVLDRGVQVGGATLEELQKFVCKPIEQFNPVALPKDFEGTLKPFQVVDYSWKYWLATNGIGCCNGLHMGLGKTVVELALIQKIIEDFGDTDDALANPHLVVAPRHVKHQWVGSKALQQGAAFFIPTVQTYSYERGEAIPEGSQLVVMSYEDYSRDFEQIRHLEWSGVTIDEAQRIKNEKTTLFQRMRGVQSVYRSALSATVFENNVGEVLSVLDWLNPGIFGDARSRRQIVRFTEKGDEERKQALNAVRAVSSPYVYVLKPDDPRVQQALPPLVQKVELLSPSKEQMAYYKREIERVQQQLERDEREGRKTTGHLSLSLFHHLSTICNHPCLNRQAVQDDTDKRKYETRDRTAPKLEFLKERVLDHFESGETALCFSPSVKALKHYFDRIEKHLRKHGFEDQLLMYNGSNSNKHLDYVIQTLQNTDHPHFVFLSTRAANTGLNLGMASHVYHLSSWFNPAVQDQATARARRIGSEHPVTETVLNIRGTIDEIIREMHINKREDFELLFGRGRDVDPSEHRSALRRLLSSLEAVV